MFCLPLISLEILQLNFDKICTYFKGLKRSLFCVIMFFFGFFISCLITILQMKLIQFETGDIRIKVALLTATTIQKVLCTKTCIKQSVSYYTIFWLHLDTEFEHRGWRKTYLFRPSFINQISFFRLNILATWHIKPHTFFKTLAHAIVPLQFYRLPFRPSGFSRHQ